MTPERRRLFMRVGLSLVAVAVLIVVVVLVVGDGEPDRDYRVDKRGEDLGSLSGAAGRAPAVTRDVTFERLLKARSEPENWLTYYGAYNGQRYSPLDQIDRRNVKRLRPAWVFQFGQFGIHASEGTYSFEAAPIIVDGVMYVTGWDGWLWAIDAKTGRELWRYKHEVAIDTPLCCGNVNRGVAVAKGKIFMTTPNAHLVAINAETGKRVWRKVFGDARAGGSATMAPLIVKNLVIVGNSGADYGVIGHIDAFDIDTGRRVWRRYNIPKPGQAGSESWPKKERAWERGGGTAWVTGTYDAELDVMYWGTGNPAPDFDGRTRRRRQPVHQLGRGDRSRRRQAALALPVDAARPVGLRRQQREHPLQW